MRWDVRVHSRHSRVRHCQDKRMMMEAVGLEGKWSFFLTQRRLHGVEGVEVLLGFECGSCGIGISGAGAISKDMDVQKCVCERAVLTFNL